MTVDWTHVIAESVTTVVPTVGSMLLYMWRRGETAKKEQLRRHAENRESIAKIENTVQSLANEQQFLPQHYHQEAYRDGDQPLTADGIIRRPNGKH